jgi:hypothetical protein
MAFEAMRNCDVRLGNNEKSEIGALWSVYFRLPTRVCSQTTPTNRTPVRTGPTPAGGVAAAAEPATGNRAHPRPPTMPRRTATLPSQSWEASRLLLPSLRANSLWLTKIPGETRTTWRFLSLILFFFYYILIVPATFIMFGSAVRLSLRGFWSFSEIFQTLEVLTLTLPQFVRPNSVPELAVFATVSHVTPLLWALENYL